MSIFDKLFRKADDKGEPQFDIAAKDLTIEAKDGSESIPVSIEAYNGGVLNVPHLGETVIDLGGDSEIPAEVPLLVDHKNAVDAMAGSGSPAIVAGRSLSVPGMLAAKSKAGSEILNGHQGGSKYQASVGVTPFSLDRINPGQTVRVNGRDFTASERGLVVVRKWRLNEVTITPLGLDRTTKVRIAASEVLDPAGIAGEPTEKGEPAMSKAGNDVQEKQAGGDVNASATGAGVDIQAMIDSAVTRAVAETTTTIQAKFEAQEKRRDDLRKVLGNGDILATAVAEGWSDERAELHVLRRSLPQSITSSFEGDGAPAANRVMEAAIMANAGCDGEELKLHYDEKTIDAAMSGRMQGFGLQAACYETMRRAGRSIQPGQFTDSTIRSAFEADRDIQAAGQSLYSLTGITSNVANKFALLGFNSVESNWRRWCQIDSVKDFKEQSFYRITAGTQYKELGIGEAIPSGQLGEEAFTNQAKTYALMMAIDRNILINDDLGMIRQGARLKLGRGAGLTMVQTIYRTLLDDAQIGSGKFFHTSHADRGQNYKTGADTALSIESMMDAITLMSKQVDKDGDPIDVEGVFLLVPPELQFLATSFCKDPEVRMSSTTSRKTTRNPVAGLLEPLKSNYLNNSKVEGGSATGWMVLADPNALGVGCMQVVFLNGRQVPFLDSSEANFNTLGIQMRGYFDFNPKLMEKACVVRMAGA